MAPLQTLSRELDEYVQGLATIAATAEFFDMASANRVATLCRRLLNALPAEPSDQQHRLTQLAIRYFILQEDAEDDHKSIVGFDDDLHVVVATIKALDLHELLKDEI